MTTYSFDLILKQSHLSDAECDALYEAGCADATIVTRSGVTRLSFDRNATSLEEAIRTAAADTRRAGFTIVRVELEAPGSVPKAG